MAAEFLPIVVLMAIGAVIAVSLPLLTAFLGTRRPDPVKDATYECGVEQIDTVRRRTFIRYYMTALLFIVFDIEIAFLYPWAVLIKRVDAKLFLFGEMALFIGVLLLAYAWL